MDHATLQNALWDFLDGEISAEKRLLVEDHLPSCPDCRDTISQWRSARPSFALAETWPRSGFSGRVMARLYGPSVEGTPWLAWIPGFAILILTVVFWWPWGVDLSTESVLRSEEPGWSALSDSPSTDNVLGLTGEEE